MTARGPARRGLLGRLTITAAAALGAALLISAAPAAAAAGDVTEFSAGVTAGSGANGITAGPNGDLWFTELTGDRIGRITPSGVVTEFTAGQRRRWSIGRRRGVRWQPLVHRG